MDSQVMRDGRLMDIADKKWREDKIPDEDIAIPVQELPDPEPDNGNNNDTLKEQEQKWNDIGLGQLHERRTMTHQTS
ncbi:Uncharacterised protein g4663 [Pycnogonum litorale]